MVVLSSLHPRHRGQGHRRPHAALHLPRLQKALHHRHEDGIPEVLKTERMGHELPGMHGVYGHVSSTMRMNQGSSARALGAFLVRTSAAWRGLHCPEAKCAAHREQGTPERDGWYARETVIRKEDRLSGEALQRARLPHKAPGRSPGNPSPC